MSLNSVNTNYGSMVALQTLNATNTALQQTQNRISTGLKVATAKDNGAIWAISQTEKSQVSALDAVKNSLNNGQSVLDVTLAAGNQLTDLLNQMKQKALAAEDKSITQSTRDQYLSDYSSLALAIDNATKSATFNGKNLLDGTDATGLSALGDDKGVVQLTSTSTDLTAATLGITATGWADDTAAKASADAVDTALGTVTAALSQYGVDSKSMANQLNMVSSVQDALNGGIGNLIDADVAKESANLTALQTKQQLGVQALSIANQSTSSLLSLFK
jgi:flagellin